MCYAQKGKPMCPHLKASGMNILMSKDITSRADALKRLAAFIPLARRYSSARNYVGAEHSQVSRLSPALARRLLLEEEVVREVLGQYPLFQVEKFIQEVLWRSYWKGWMEMRPEVWTDYLRQVEEAREEATPAQSQRIEAILSGGSGLGIIDHFTRELITTGYLHNHARMWWSSYWIHVERLPWQIGAAFFFSHLLDADAASNTLSWRWVAGWQTEGKSYLIRKSNLEKYCSESILKHSQGISQFADGAVESILPRSVKKSPMAPINDYPEVVQDKGKRLGIWVHRDDACAEIGPMSGLAPVSVAAFSSSHSSEQYQLSKLSQDFTEEVLQDALQRSADHFSCPRVFGDSEDFAPSLLRWINENKIEEVLTFAPLVGPVRDQLPWAERELAEIGVPLRKIRRSWDGALFGEAKAGFFPFWKKAKKWLAQRTDSGELQLEFREKC